MRRAAAGVALLQGTPPPSRAVESLWLNGTTHANSRHVMWSFIRLQLLLPVKSAVFFEWAIQNVSCFDIAFMRFPVVM